MRCCKCGLLPAYKGKSGNLYCAECVDFQNFDSYEDITEIKPQVPIDTNFQEEDAYIRSEAIFTKTGRILA